MSTWGPPLHMMSVCGVFLVIGCDGVVLVVAVWCCLGLFGLVGDSILRGFWVRLALPSDGSLSCRFTDCGLHWGCLTVSGHGVYRRLVCGGVAFRCGCGSFFLVWQHQLSGWVALRQVKSAGASFSGVPVLVLGFWYAVEALLPEAGLPS